MTDMYNFSQLATSGTPVGWLETINAWSGDVVVTALYFGIALIIIVGIKSKFPLEVALSLGGFMSAIAGVLLFIMGLVPVWAPIVFATFSVIGTALGILAKGD